MAEEGLRGGEIVEGNRGGVALEGANGNVVVGNRYRTLPESVRAIYVGDVVSMSMNTTSTIYPATTTAQFTVSSMRRN